MKGRKKGGMKGSGGAMGKRTQRPKPASSQYSQNNTGGMKKKKMRGPL